MMLFTTKAQDRMVAEVQIFNGYEEPLTTVQVVSNPDGWFLVTDGEGCGLFCLGTTRHETRATLRKMLAFIKDDIDFEMFHINYDLRVVLYREYVEDPDEATEETWPYIETRAMMTDGSGLYSDIPEKLIRMALSKI